MYLKHIDLLERTVALQNDQIILQGLRLGETNLRIDGLIEEKNKYKYRNNWSLFGMKVSGASLALLALGAGYAIGR